MNEGFLGGRTALALATAARHVQVVRKLAAAVAGAAADDDGDGEPPRPSAMVMATADGTAEEALRAIRVQLSSGEAERLPEGFYHGAERPATSKLAASEIAVARRIEGVLSVTCGEPVASL